MRHWIKRCQICKTLETYVARVDAYEFPNPFMKTPAIINDSS